MMESSFQPYESLERPRSLGFWIVAGYLVLFLIRPWEELFPVLQSIRTERLYGVAMIVIVGLTGRGPRLTAQAIAVGMFAGAVLVSTLRAWDPAYAWPELYRYATVVIVYYLLQSVCRSPSELYWLIVTYVGTMFVYLGKSLWEYVLYDKHQYAQNVKRLVGIELTYGEPNAVAMSAVLSLPAWLFLWMRRHALVANMNGLLRSSMLLGINTYPLLVVVAVGLTNSRAGMVGLVACVLGAAVLFQRRVSLGRNLIVAMGIVVVVWIAAPDEQKNRLRTLWDPSAGPSMAAASAGGRWEGFLAAMQMLQARPVTGVGVGNFVPYRVTNVDGVGLVAHNLPGQILGETGWFGGICFAVLVFTIWRDAQTLGSWSRDDPRLLHDWYLSRAILLTLGLLFLFGLSLHNGLRYNWLWLAAFGSLAVEFGAESVDELDYDFEYKFEHDIEQNELHTEAQQTSVRPTADSMNEGFAS